MQSFVIVVYHYTPSLSKQFKNEMKRVKYVNRIRMLSPSPFVAMPARPPLSAGPRPRSRHPLGVQLPRQNPTMCRSAGVRRAYPFTSSTLPQPLHATSIMQPVNKGVCMSNARTMTADEASSSVSSTAGLDRPLLVAETLSKAVLDQIGPFIHPRSPPVAAVATATTTNKPSYSALTEGRANVDTISSCGLLPVQYSTFVGAPTVSRAEVGDGNVTAAKLRYPSVYATGSAAVRPRRTSSDTCCVPDYAGVLYAHTDPQTTPAIPVYQRSNPFAAATNQYVEHGYLCPALGRQAIQSQRPTFGDMLPGAHGHDSRQSVVSLPPIGCVLDVPQTCHVQPSEAANDAQTSHVNNPYTIVDLEGVSMHDSKPLSHKNSSSPSTSQCISAAFKLLLDDTNVATCPSFTEECITPRAALQGMNTVRYKIQPSEEEFVNDEHNRFRDARYAIPCQQRYDQPTSESDIKLENDMTIWTQVPPRQNEQWQIATEKLVPSRDLLEIREIKCEASSRVPPMQGMAWFRFDLYVFLKLGN